MKLMFFRIFNRVVRWIAAPSELKIQFNTQTISFVIAGCKLIPETTFKRAYNE